MPKSVTLDDIPLYKTIDGHRYKYLTWFYSKAKAEEYSERMKNLGKDHGKAYSTRVVPNKKSKEYRVYIRTVK